MILDKVRLILKEILVEVSIGVIYCIKQYIKEIIGNNRE